MLKLSRISLLALVVIFATASIIFALQSQEIISRLSAGNTRIKINEKRETIDMAGPIDFNHMGRKITGDSAVLEMERDVDGKRNPLLISVTGKVNYSDDIGYSMSCTNAKFNFATGILELITQVVAKGKDTELRAHQVTYNKTTDFLKASGSVRYSGITNSIPLILGSTADKSVDFIITCNSIEVDNSKKTAQADGGVIFRSVNTRISCDKLKMKISDGEVTEVFCEGNIEFNDPEMHGKSSTALYSRDKGTLVLQGTLKDKVQVSYKGQEFTGREVILNFKNGRELTLGEGRISLRPDNQT